MLIKRLQFAVVLTAVIGMLVPQGVLLSETNAPAARPKVLDVALGANGRMTGQFVDSQGKGVPARELILLSRNGVQRRTRTNQRGEFRFEQLRGGMMVLTDQEQSVALRVWTGQAAPKQAVRRVLLVRNERTTRGQQLNPPNRGFLTDHAAAEFVVAGLIAGAIIALTADDDSGSP